MRLLLDTQVFLWAMTAPEKNSVTARRSMDESANDRLVSIASLWELAIKVSLGKPAVRERPFDRAIEQGIRDIAAEVLSISIAHIAAVESLQHHHRDPFDRLLVSQAATEGATLLSADTSLDAYGVRRVW